MFRSRKITESEFVALLTSHQSMIYAYILCLHPDRIAAQDIAQEAVLVMWKKMGDFEKGTNFKAWAKRVAYWQTMAYLKKRKRSKLVHLEDEVIDLLSEEAEFVLEDHDERCDALKRCLGKLGEKEAEMLTDHYQRDVSLSDLAGRLGKTPVAVRQAMFRIRRSLRRCIEHQTLGTSA